MQYLLVFLEFILCLTSFGSTNDQSYLHRWECNSSNGACTRVSSESVKAGDTVYPSLEICRLVCGDYGALWPKPTGSYASSGILFEFSISSLDFTIKSDVDEIKTFLEDIVDIFKDSVSYKGTPNCANLENRVSVSLSCVSNDTSLNWNTDESYNLEITTKEHENSVKITAETVFGVRHALETLSQLIDNDGSCHVILNDAKISDAPVYPHRGLLLDTARNFLPVDTIKKQIDAMSYSKLNVLHWHATDSQSFPLEIPTLPNMTKFGAYSDDKIYNPEQVEDLIAYAKFRGVRVIIEFDAPSHAGNGWQWGPDAGLGNLAVCIEKEPWRSNCIEPPCGQLNPINPFLYKVLKDLYSDILNYLPKDEVMHMGGDEVFIPCWNSTPEIITALGNNPRTTETFLDLWADFQDQARSVFDSVVGHNNTPIILWTSHLTNADIIEKYLSKERYVIQTWVPASDSLPADLLELGYQIIVSTKDAWYLDHGFWGTTLYHGWKLVYNNKIPTDPNTLGGEVCMWGEYVDDTSVESKIWPRAAAAAERLWSNPTLSANEVGQRFYRHRERLVSRGIAADAVISRWCYQNEGKCS